MTLNLCGQPRSMCGAEYSGGMALCQSSRKRERKSFQIWTVHRLVLAAPFHEPTLYHKKESKLFFGGCRKLAGVNGFFWWYSQPVASMYLYPSKRNAHAVRISGSSVMVFQFFAVLEHWIKFVVILKKQRDLRMTSTPGKEGAEQRIGNFHRAVSRHQERCS